MSKKKISAKILDLDQVIVNDEITSDYYSMTECLSDDLYIRLHNEGPFGRRLISYSNEIHKQLFVDFKRNKNRQSKKKDDLND